MMFRKLYWVAEDLQPSGSSQIRGVFTSVPNLLRCGLEEGLNLSQFRLSLTRLDCPCGTIATWSGDRFRTMGDDLVQFVATEDITEEQRQSLAHWVVGNTHVAA
jgi:hypothetical protein